MIRRFLLALAVVWAILLWAPIFRAQSSRVNEAPDQYNSRFYRPLAEAELEALLRQHPRDGVLNLELLRAQFPKNQPAHWRAFDALIERLPGDLPLRRAKLIESTKGLGVLPFYAPLYGPKNNALPTQADRDNIEKMSRTTGYGDLDRAILLRQARAGEEQAPDDGFFPWMEAIAAWNRDDEPALRALERAAKCTAFEDGTQAYQLALLKWTQTQRPLDWDDKWGFFYSTLLPHYARMRALQREVVWSGIARYRRGDKAGAYRRWNIALRASGQFRRAQGHTPRAFLIGLTAAEATQSSVWEIVGKSIGGVTAKRASARKLAAFTALARRDGQGALANFAASEAAEFEAKSLLTDIESSEAGLRFNATDTGLQLQLPWLERNVLWLCVAGALALGLCAPARWLERRLHRDFIGRVSVRQIGLLSVMWLGALGWALADRLKSDWWELSGNSNSKPAPSSDPVVALFDNPVLFWSAVAATLVLSLAFGIIHRYDERQKGGANHDSRTNVPALLWVGSLVLLGTMPLFDGGGYGWENFGWAWLAFTIAAWTATVFVGERREMSPALRTRSRLLSAALACGAGATALALFPPFLADWMLLGGAIVVPVDRLLMVSSALWTVLLLLYLLVSDKSWRPSAARAMGIALQTLGGVALVCSVALLLASLAALPVRARQNRIADDYIARGEIAWMRNAPSE